MRRGVQVCGGEHYRIHGDSNLHFEYMIQEWEEHHEDAQTKHKDSSYPKRYVPSVKATLATTWKPNL